MSYNKETGMYEGYIYKIYNDVNDKLYICQTITTILQRWKCHCSASKNGNQAIYNAMRKYGLEFFHIIEICRLTSDTKDELCKILNDAEMSYIQQYKSLTTQNGYNVTQGGDSAAINIYTSVDQYSLDGTFVTNYESIEIASVLTGVYDGSISMNITHHNKTAGGYIFVKSGETPNLDIKSSYSKTIYQYSKDGTLINTFDSVTSAANFMSILRSGISGVLNKCNKTYKGFIWVDEEHEFILPISRHKIICQYDSYGVCINKFENAVVAQKITGIDSSAILLNCHGIQLSAGYYVWRFEDDLFNLYPLPGKMKPLIAFDDDRNEVGRYHYMKEAIELRQCSETGIYQSIKRGTKCDGLYWEYLVL